jgi:polar amino acid transport system permease protein
MTDWEIVLSEWPRFASGFGTTLALFLISTLGAFLIGMIFVNILYGRNRIARKAVGIYIDGMRMLPFLIFVYLLYYGLPSVGISMSAWTAGIVGLTLYHCAYVAEILRGAWSQLPAGQAEAARAQGHHGYRMFGRIILPQLVLNSAPILGNQLIYMLKDTAFLMIITVQELHIRGLVGAVDVFRPAGTVCRRTAALLGDEPVDRGSRPRRKPICKGERSWRFLTPQPAPPRSPTPWRRRRSARASVTSRCCAMSI